MRKRVLARGNMHRSDRYRVLVTDTVPGDIPIIFSNDGFYKNMKNRQEENQQKSELVERILHPSRPYTIPYRYNILRARTSIRKLSLVHPGAQIEVAEFYKQYDQIICYYCRKSEASIRSPRKVGSLFFVRGFISTKNKLKNSGVDTVSVENAVGNPASYFSYSGHSRAHQFFSSSDYLRLEKKFSIMQFADVSKCFHSIYTHTLFWAIKDVASAKENISALTFSNSFDRIMQSMNFNETNGICVGAEVSRVFAELILSEIDCRVIKRLSTSNVTYNINFEFRRYVDNYYLFSDSEATAAKVMTAIQLSLSEFNLHLNENKTELYKRPFITKKSRLIYAANESLQSFFAKFIVDKTQEGVSFSYPLRIRRSPALLKSFLDSIKIICFDNDASYQDASNYIIAALGHRVTSLIDAYHLGSKIDDVEEENYVGSLLLLLEGIYFFYTVHPSVPASLSVSKSAIQASRFFKERLPDRSAFVVEQLIRWTHQFVRTLSELIDHKDTASVPLEALNLLLVLGDVARDQPLFNEMLREFSGTISRMEYFEIISLIFCAGGSPDLAPLVALAFQRAKDIVFSDLGPRVESQAAHLALDLLSCPYLPLDQRGYFLNELRKKVELPALNKVLSHEVAKAFEAGPWFVNWNAADLLNMIKKKELSSVY